jgi:CTP:molybdopterin cytidylyltransferase MocA
MISAAILAVGCARQTSEPDSAKSLLQSILESVLASDVDEVICLTDDLAQARRDIKLNDQRLFWYRKSAGARGQSGEVIAALWASHPRSDGVMFVACEPPVASTALLNAMIERFKASVASIIAPTRAGIPRGPLLFRRDLFGEILGLTGDDSVAGLVGKYARNTALVPWQEQTEAAMVSQRVTPARLKKRV